MPRLVLVCFLTGAPLALFCTPLNFSTASEDTSQVHEGISPPNGSVPFTLPRIHVSQLDSDGGNSNKSRACWVVDRYTNLRVQTDSKRDRCKVRFRGREAALRACERRAWCGGVVRDNGIGECGRFELRTPNPIEQGILHSSVTFRLLARESDWKTTEWCIRQQDDAARIALVYQQAANGSATQEALEKLHQDLTELVTQKSVRLKSRLVRRSFSRPLPLQHSSGWRCPFSLSKEPLFRALVGSLFAEGLMPPGAIIDAGANSGEDACFYAERTGRIVHAIDPLLTNIRFMQQSFGFLPNLLPEVGGLGSARRWLRAQAEVANAHSGEGAQLKVTEMSDVALPARTEKEKGGGTISSAELHADGYFEVRRVDELLSSKWQGERLSFAHFDVEGGELDVLKGALRTLLLDRPVFSVEVFMVNKKALATQLLWLASKLNYTSYVVEEECGLPADCRNVLNVPTERHATFRDSSSFRLAKKSLIPVTALSVADGKSRGAGYPCCQQGGFCCVGKQQEKLPRSCCWPTLVRRRQDEHPKEFIGMAKSRWGEAPEPFTQMLYQLTAFGEHRSSVGHNETG